MQTTKTFPQLHDNIKRVPPKKLRPKGKHG